MTPVRCASNCFCKCLCYLEAEIDEHESLACHARISGALRRNCNGVVESPDPLEYGIYATVDNSEGDTIYSGPIGGMPAVIRVASGVTYNVSVYQWEDAEITGTQCQSNIEGADDSYTVPMDPFCDPCDLVDCDEYPDLEPCECVDFNTGDVKILTGVLWTLAGTSTGGIAPVYGGGPPKSLPSVDYSGTYDFPVEVDGDSCFSSPETFYLISSTFLGTEAGFDWWAVLCVYNAGSSPYRMTLLSSVAQTPIGSTPTGKPTPFDPASDWSLGGLLESWSFNSEIVICPGNPCLCFGDGSADGTYTSGGLGYGHGLSGGGAPSVASVEFAYA